MNGIVSIGYDGQPLWTSSTKNIFKSFSQDTIMQGFWVADKVTNITPHLKRADFFGTSLHYFNAFERYNGNVLPSNISTKLLSDLQKVINVLDPCLELNMFSSLSDAIVAKYKHKLETPQKTLTDLFQQVFSQSPLKIKTDTSLSKSHNIQILPSQADLESFLIPTSNKFNEVKGVPAIEKCGFNLVRVDKSIHPLGIKKNATFWVSNQSMWQLAELTDIRIVKTIIFRDSQTINELFPFIGDLLRLGRDNLLALSAINYIMGVLTSNEKPINEFIQFGMKSLYFALYCEQLNINQHLIEKSILVANQFDDCTKFSIKLSEPFNESLNALSHNGKLSPFCIKKIKQQMKDIK